MILYIQLRNEMSMLKKILACISPQDEEYTRLITSKSRAVDEKETSESLEEEELLLDGNLMDFEKSIVMFCDSEIYYKKGSSDAAWIPYLKLHDNTETTNLTVCAAHKSKNTATHGGGESRPTKTSIDENKPTTYLTDAEFYTSYVQKLGLKAY